MARFPLPAGLEGSEKLPRTRQLLQNCFNTGEDRILGRPGNLLIATVGGVCRGGFKFNNALYYVYSNELRKFTDVETGVFTINPTALTGSANIDVAVGENEAVIVVKGEFTFTLDKSDTLTDVSGNDNFVPFSSVAHQNDKFIYVASDGTIVKVSDVGNGGSIQPLAFFSPRVRPDDSRVVYSLGENLYIGGTQSIVKFRDTGATPNPFSPVGSSFDIGVIGGLLEVDSGFLFIGRKRNQSPGIFIVGIAQVAKISNEPIDLVLTTYTDLELSQAISGRINWRGHDFATLTLRRDSFGFFGGNWFRLDTVIDDVSRPWSGGFIVEFNNEYFSGFEDKFGKFTDINTDHGDRITRILETNALEPEAENFSLQSVEVGISQGFNPSVTFDEGAAGSSVALQLSEDGERYFEPNYRKTGGIGRYSDKLVWNEPGGLGIFRGAVFVRLITTEDVVFNIDYLDLKFRKSYG